MRYLGETLTDGLCLLLCLLEISEERVPFLGRLIEFIAAEPVFMPGQF